MDQNLFLNLFRNDNFLEANTLNLLPLATYFCDTAGVIRNYNKAGLALLGREPVTGNTWHQFLSLRDSESGACPMTEALQEGHPVTGNKFVFHRPDGGIRHIITSATPIFDKSGQLIGTVNVLTDISEFLLKEKSVMENTQLMESMVREQTADLTRKNEELKKSEERYHKMVEEVQDYAILLLDRDGTILNWNRGAQRIKGYREDEIIGKNFRIFYLEDDRKSKLPEKLINQAATEGRAIHEGARLRKDGTRFWGSITITALHNDEGDVIGFSKVTRDLTDKKIAEDQIKQYTEELEFQNRELEQFAYAAAHDMREPLRKILYYNNHLLDAVFESLDEKSQEYLKRSISAATRMQRLIDDLLAYSKTSMDNDDSELVSLDDVLQDSLSSLQDSIRQSEAQVDIVPLPVIEGVPVQLQQLFDNLLGNSLKYRKKEIKPHIRITHTIVEDTEEENPEQKKKYHQIAISDNGIGFEQENAEAIFDLFYRLHAGSEYQGTGIGLAICKKIMQNHHGSISATGKAGIGAVFTLDFPVHGQ